jgi:hypothetical protein
VSFFGLPAACFWAVAGAPVADVVFVAVVRVRMQTVRIGGSPIAARARPRRSPDRRLPPLFLPHGKRARRPVLARTTGSGSPSA